MTDDPAAEPAPDLDVLGHDDGYAAFSSSLDALMARAESATVPTQILHASAVAVDSLARFNGLSRDAISQREWEQHYHDLRRGIVADSPLAGRLASLDALKDRARAYSDRGVVPLAVMSIRYNHPDTRLVAAVSRAFRAQRAIVVDAPEAMLGERRAFAASALLPDRFDVYALLPPAHDGLTLTFHLPAEFWLNPELGHPDGVTIDFDDGSGPRYVAVDLPVQISYPAPGTRRLVLRHRSGADDLISVFTLDVNPASSAPLPDETWPIQSTIPYQGKTNSGKAYVWYGSDQGQKHTQLTHPFVMSEGFPGGYTSTELYDMLNQQDTLTTLMAKGFDAVVLSYTSAAEPRGGTDYLQRNAFVAVACLQSVMAKTSNRIVAGGASMGGVIMRYALTYMEKNGLPHQTATFLSFDSPQLGATVPPSVQWIITGLALAGDATSRTNAKLLRSVSSRQMLYITADFGNRNWSTVGTDPLHTEFYNELISLGSYPTQCQKLGISNGASDGSQSTTVPDAAHTLDWWGSPCAGADAWATSTRDKPFGHLRHLRLGGNFFVHYKFAENYDGAPGGTTDAPRRLADGMRRSGYGWVVKQKYPLNCFIPATSALGIAGSLYTPIPTTGATTAFDHYYISASVNSGHVEITPDIKQFLLQYLNAPPSVDRDRVSASYTQTAELAMANQPLDYGYAVSLNAAGNVAVICAYGQGRGTSGVFVYERGHGVWLEPRRIDQTQTVVAGVSDDGRVIVTSTQGSVSVFSGPGWSTKTTLTIPSAGWSWLSVAVSGDGKSVAVGACGSRAFAGAAYLFSGSDWADCVTLAVSNPNFGYGNAVDINRDGSVVVVGAWSGGNEGTAYVFSEADWSQPAATLEPASRTAQDIFGAAVAVSADGSTVAVGAPRASNLNGSVTVFTGPSWGMTATVTCAANPQNAQFGSALAISDDGAVLAVGSQTTLGHVYLCHGSSFTTQTVLSETGGMHNDTGWVSLDGSGKQVLVGDPTADKVGAAYLVSGPTWARRKTFTVNDGAGPELFGAGATLGGTTALVGAPGADHGTGQSYVYSQVDGDWQLTATVSSPDTSTDVQFGSAVALSGDGTSALVGGPGAQDGAGSVVLVSDSAWTKPVVLTVPNTMRADRLGSAVALNDTATSAVVGAPGRDGRRGAAYVFRSADWTQPTQLGAPTSVRGDEFGRAVAMSGDGSTVLVGAPYADEHAGAAFLYSNENWTSPRALTAKDAVSGAGFGETVAVSADGQIVVVGMPGDDLTTGAAYVYAAPDWTQQAMLTPPAGQHVRGFGYDLAVSADGSVIVIGAAETGEEAGMVFCFSGTTWSDSLAVTPIEPQAGSQFGSSVAVSADGDTIIVGAPGTEAGNGAAFVFASDSSSTPYSPAAHSTSAAPHA